MKIRATVHERGTYPAWVWVGVGLACASSLGLGLAALPVDLVPPCGFHLVTGHPCPTCGATRMGFLLLAGRPAEAFLMSPLLFLLTAALALWVVAGAALRLAGRDLFLEVSEGEEKWWWLGFIATFLINWAYIWHAGV